MIKYDVKLIKDIIAYDRRAETEQPIRNVQNEIATLIADGYEILQAIPFTHPSVCGIQYILKKAIIVDEKS